MSTGKRFLHAIVFFSPAGSTRLVAQHIRHCLGAKGQEAHLFDLTAPRQALQTFLSAMRKPVCLWIGSPVYCDHAVPLIHDCIAALPGSGSDTCAIPFVTWGGVTSGLALFEMATHLQQQQWTVTAAAKILAVHSSMWQADKPLACGHPNAEDFGQVELLVHRVLATLDRGPFSAFDTKRLDYLSPSLRADATKKSLQIAKAAMRPLSVDDKRCNQCGTCAEVCPVSAIRLTPLPVLDHASCILCLQCVRTCPQEAFPFDGPALAARIMAMGANSDEARQSEIFY